MFRKPEESGVDEVVLSPTDVALSSILLVASIFLIAAAMSTLVKYCTKKMKVKHKGP